MSTGRKNGFTWKHTHQYRTSSEYSPCKFRHVLTINIIGICCSLDYRNTFLPCHKRKLWIEARHTPATTSDPGISTWLCAKKSGRSLGNVQAVWLDASRRGFILWISYSTITGGHTSIAVNQHPRLNRKPRISLCSQLAHHMCAFFTLNRSVYPSASSTASTRVDSSILQSYTFLWYSSCGNIKCDMAAVRKLYYSIEWRSLNQCGLPGVYMILVYDSAT